MNYKEAKDYFKSLLTTYEENNCAMHPAYESAVKALEKLELIDNWVDTNEAMVVAELVHGYGIDAVKDACEKQIPKKPIKDGIDRICPICDCYVGYVDAMCNAKWKYCIDCGQAIDWSNDNEQ